MPTKLNNFFQLLKNNCCIFLCYHFIVKNNFVMFNRYIPLLISYSIQKPSNDVFLIEITRQYLKCKSILWSHCMIIFASSFVGMRKQQIVAVDKKLNIRRNNPQPNNKIRHFWSDIWQIAYHTILFSSFVFKTKTFNPNTDSTSLFFPLIISVFYSFLHS